MSPLQKHAKLIRFSHPASRPSPLLSAQGRGRRSGSFWDPVPRSSIPLDWYSANIITSSHSCCMAFSTVSTRTVTHERRFAKLQRFFPLQSHNDLQARFPRWICLPPLTKPPSSPTDGFLQLQPLFSSLTYFQSAISHKAEANTLKRRAP